jgi:glycosyltransferase involved in cell wall biosynthesis
MKFKILLVIDSLGSGGAQRQIVTLAVALKRQGHDVSFFIYHPEYHFLAPLEQEGIPVHYCRKPSRFSVKPVIELRRILLRERHAVAIAFLETPSLYLELASLSAGETRVIVSERLGFADSRLDLKTYLLQQFHRLADVITVNSHHQADRMARHFPWMRAKLKTIWNGFDLEQFRPSPTLNPNPASLRLLCVSSVSFKKNSISLARAVQICRERAGIRVEVSWAGALRVSGEGTAARDETDAFLRSSDLQDQWCWLGVRSDIPALLASCDALVHPSFFEGLPNAICEAMACGRPVLASRVCDHPLLVGHGERGLLFDPSSERDIADAIRHFASMGIADRQRMGLAARQFCEERLSLDRFIDAYSALLDPKSGACAQGA